MSDIALFLTSIAMTVAASSTFSPRNPSHNQVVMKPFSPRNVTPPSSLTLPPPPSPHLSKQLSSLPVLSELLSTRKSVTPTSQSVSYSNTSPLTVLSGDSCYLHSYERSSSDEILLTTYLDTRNNVPSCGHCNASVNTAISSQVHTINTNTRYLHPHINSLASRLIATLPPLEDDAWVVTLTNSGSESNDLALRIARRFTSNGPVITYDMSYHGHTSSLISVSPYKLKQSGETSPRHNTHWLKHPNVYRCPASDPATYYKSEFDDLLSTLKSPPILIYEIGMSVGGVCLPPPTYLAHVTDKVRALKGCVIYDCVQTGCGRFGENKWWGFEREEGAIPDIVTVGKPLGNGHPISALCVKKSVIRNFDTCGMEYFNTFGGNPVSCAAALAVMEEIDRQCLPQNADLVGSYLMSEFQSIRVNYPEMVGDVRGIGLFIGVEILTGLPPSSSLSQPPPGTAETSWLCSQLKNEYRILSTIDGQFDNVIVVKPPLTFGIAEATYFTSCFRELVKKLVHLKATSQFDSSGGKTPT